MSRRNNPRKPNGHDGPNGRVNGSGGGSAHVDAESHPSQGKNEKARNGNGRSSKEETDAIELLGSTDVAAIQDGAAYFDAVAARVDLVGASARLVITKDLKISKSELDRLREMKFGKAVAAGVEEIVRVEPGDIPRPVR